MQDEGLVKELAAALIFQILLHNKGPMDEKELFSELADNIKISNNMFQAAIFHRNFIRFEKYVELAVRRLPGQQPLMALMAGFFSAGHPLTAANVRHLLQSVRETAQDATDNLEKDIEAALAEAGFFLIKGKLYGSGWWLKQRNYGGNNAKNSYLGKGIQDNSVTDIICGLMLESDGSWQTFDLLNCLDESGVYCNLQELFCLLYFDSRFQYLGNGKWVLDEHMDRYWLNVDETKCFSQKEEEALALAFDFDLIDTYSLDAVFNYVVTTEKPISLEEIMAEVLKKNPDDHAYQETLRTLNHLLSADGRFVMVSQREWFLINLLPAAIFNVPPKVHSNGDIDRVRADIQQLSVNYEKKEISGSNSQILSVTEFNLANGCLSGINTGLFPGFPMINQVNFMDEEGTCFVGWFNKANNTIWGLEEWFHQREIERNDMIEIAVVSREKSYFRIWLHEQQKKETTQKPKTGRGNGTGTKYSAVNRNLLNSLIDIVRQGNGITEDDILVKIEASFHGITKEAFLVYLNQYEFFYKSDTDAKWFLKSTLEIRRRSRYQKGRILSAEEQEAAAAFAISDLSIRTNMKLRNLPGYIVECQSIQHIAVISSYYPALDADSEKELIERAQKGEVEARNILINAYLPSLWTIVANKMSKLSLSDAYDSWHCFEDAFQESVFGLIDCIEKFDADKSARLYSYLIRSYNAVDRWLGAQRLRDTDLAVNDYHIVYEFERVLAEEIKTGNGNIHEVSRRIAEKHNLSKNKACKIQNCVEIAMLDLEEQLANAETEDDLTEIISQRLLKEDIAALLRQLKPREAEVLKMRFGFGDIEPKTLEEISASFGLTRERIRQIQEKVLAKLRKMKKVQIMEN